MRSLSRTAAKAGIACDVTDLVPADPSRPESQDATVEGIRVALIALSENPLIHGILLQTPLPGGARLADLAGLIDPAKDVDGANPTSLGRLMTGLPFAPATARWRAGAARLLPGRAERRRRWWSDVRRW